MSRDIDSTPSPRPLPQGEGEKYIINHIRAHGPVSVAEYMTLALQHPKFGYYIRRDPLGVSGDFITAPEISQIFGELCGAWLARQWHVMGRPQSALVELGPGRGTLMADALRTTKSIPGFHAAISVHLVETSPALKEKQWQALAGKHPSVQWHDSVDTLPQEPLLLIANEFFDALPVRQFIDAQERAVGLDENNHLCFTVIPAKAGIHIPESVVMDSRLRGNDIIECCEPAVAIMHTLAHHIATYGGAALVVDYGYAGPKSGDTLQAMKQHAYHDVLSDPGCADITTHVDFSALAQAAKDAHASVHGPVAQGVFLNRIGAGVRVQKLCENAAPEQKTAMLAAYARLTSIEQMGDLFKVLAVTHRNHPRVEGF